MRHTLAVVAAIACLATGQALAADYRIDDLTTRYGEQYSWSFINNAGELAGYKNGSAQLELRLRSGSVSFRDGLSRLTAFANDGTVYFSVPQYVPERDVSIAKRRDVDGTITEMPRLVGGVGSYPSAVTDVNDNGIAVGYSPTNALPATPVIYQDGKAIEIDTPYFYSMASGINNRGNVVGYDLEGSGAFIYADGNITLLPGGILSARKINDSNLIAGDRKLDDGSEKAFLYQDGVFTDISVAGKDNSGAIDLNNSGILLGRAWGGSGISDSEYFLYVNGETILLNDVIASQGYGDWEVQFATDINDNGQVLLSIQRNAGSGMSEERELLLTPTLPVPEPGTWAMLLAGLGCVGVLKRRRAA